MLTIKWLFICAGKLARTRIGNTAHSRSTPQFWLISKTEGSLIVPVSSDIDYWLSIVKWVLCRRCSATKGIGDCRFAVEEHWASQFHHPSILTDKTLEAERLLRSLRGDFEPVYVAPACLSREALHHRCQKAQAAIWWVNSKNSESYSKDPWKVERGGWGKEIPEICPSMVFSQESPPSPWIDRYVATNLTDKNIEWQKPWHNASFRQSLSMTRRTM